MGSLLYSDAVVVPLSSLLSLLSAMQEAVHTVTQRSVGCGGGWYESVASRCDATTGGWFACCAPARSTSSFRYQKGEKLVLCYGLRRSLRVVVSITRTADHAIPIILLEVETQRDVKMIGERALCFTGP